MNLNLNTHPQIWNHVAIEIVEAANRGQNWVGGIEVFGSIFTFGKSGTEIFNFDLRMNSTCFECQVGISSFCMMLFNHVPTSPLSIPSLFSSPLYSLSHLYILVLKWLFSFGLFIWCVCVCVGY